jgi:hypothetical protein
MSTRRIHLAVFRLLALSLAVLGGLVECAALLRSRLLAPWLSPRRMS